MPAHRRPARRKQIVHVKIIVIGPPGSGKTSFMLRYTKDDFDIFKHPSVSYNNNYCHVEENLCCSESQKMV